jgi:hypothetical protein
MTSHPPALHPSRAPGRRLRAALLLLLALPGLAVGAAFAALPAAAYAQAGAVTITGADTGFGAGRERLAYTLNPGVQQEDGVAVTNPGAEPLTLTLRAADAFTTRAGDLGYREGAGKGVGAWLRLERETVTVRPGATTEVPFTVSVPDGATPGDYVGGVVATPAGGAGAGGAAITVGVRVGGALKPSVAVETIETDYSGTANPLGKGEATVRYTVHNTGNAIVAASPAVTVSGPFGLWEAKAGRLPATPQLLPRERWTGTATVADVAPAVRVAAKVTLRGLVTDAAGSTAGLPPVDETGHAIVIPWTLLLIVVVVIGLVAVLVVRTRRAGSAPAPRRTTAA